MKIFLRNFLHSGFTFKKEDYEHSARYTLVNGILGIGVVIISMLATLLFLDNKYTYAASNVLYLAVLIASILALRLKRKAYNIVIPFILFASIILISVALILYPDEDVRISWFLLLIIMSFFTSGAKIGLVTSAVSIATVFVIRVAVNNDPDNYVTILAFAILILGTVVSALYEKRNQVIKKNLLDLNVNLENKVDQRTKEIRDHHGILEYQARHDILTGLPNRAYLNTEIEKIMEKSKKNGTKFALFFIDLDNFKNINDSLGHDAGDEVLIKVSERLSKHLRYADILVRLGGDEFIIVVTNMKSKKHASRVATKLRDVMMAPLSINTHTFYVTSSIGISIFPDDGVDIDQLLKYSDAAMYKAKHLGKNNYQYYSSEMTALAYERMMMENSLRQAVAKEEFTVHYQPQVDMLSGNVLGVEALVRWNHPTKGMVTPEKFIGLAEERNLIVEIDTLVISDAMRQVGEWHNKGLFSGILFLNVSLQWLESNNFYDLVEGNLSKYDFDSRMLGIEITEGEIMENPDESIAKMKRLKKLGIHLAIDDFGTGYSSLSYLSKLPVDTVKIDKSFIKDIPHKEDDAVIVKTIISLAESLNLGIVAEGVETPEQRDFLIEHGCNTCQGYYYGRPVSADEIVEKHLSGCVAS